MDVVSINADRGVRSMIRIIPSNLHRVLRHCCHARLRFIQGFRAEGFRVRVLLIPFWRARIRGSGGWANETLQNAPGAEAW